MLQIIRSRAAAWVAILRESRWYKWVAASVAALSFYDLAVSQVLPTVLADKLPKLRDVIAMSTGFLPWWGWLICFLVVTLIAVSEHAIRVSRVGSSSANLGMVSLQGKDRAHLEVDAPRLHPTKDDRHRVWRANVTNKGPGTAINASMRLLSMEPPPRYGMWSADYPYQVRLVSADGSPQFECQIRAKDTVRFGLMTGWQSGGGEFYTSGLDNRLLDGRLENRIRIEPNEEWVLNYEVVAENADRVEFSIRMFVSADVVMMESAGEHVTRQPLLST